MSDDRPPIEQVLDVVLYAPIGVALEVQRRLPELVRDGRRQAEQRVVLARFIGKMAVHVGRQELNKRITALRQPAPSSGTPATVVDTTATNTTATNTTDTNTTDTNTTDTNTTDTDRSPSVPVEVVVHVSVDDLPIAGYDSLSASQVVGRLASLTQTELDAVESYEAAHRSRRTILAKVAQLRTRGV